RMARTDIERAAEPQAARKLGGEIGENVPEHIRRNDDVEPIRLPHDMLHHGVDKDVVDAKIRIGTRRLPANVEEHAVADLQDIGFVNDSEVLAPAHGELAGGFGNSLAAKSRDAAERD